MEGELDGAACAGAWRFLCAGMMLQTVQRLEAEAKRDRAPFMAVRQGGNVKECAYQKREARRWLDGGIGLITFEDCCEALNVDCDRARQMIESHCASGGRRTKRNHKEVRSA